MLTDFGPINEIRFHIFGKRNSNLFWSFSSRKLHKNYQTSDKINSHIVYVECLRTFSSNSQIWPV